MLLFFNKVNSSVNRIFLFFNKGNIFVNWIFFSFNWSKYFNYFLTILIKIKIQIKVKKQICKNWLKWKLLIKIS